MLPKEEQVAREIVTSQSQGERLWSLGSPVCFGHKVFKEEDKTNASARAIACFVTYMWGFASIIFVTIVCVVLVLQQQQKACKMTFPT